MSGKLGGPMKNFKRKSPRRSTERQSMEDKVPTPKNNKIGGKKKSKPKNEYGGGSLPRPVKPIVLAF